MNEFQAVFTIVTFFVVRFALPAVGIYAFARLVRHFQGPDPEAELAPNVQTRVAH